MMKAGDNDVTGLVESTEKLLQARHFPRERSVELTRREHEVPAGIVRTWANREIAASLNVCERTVKFRRHFQSSTYAARMGLVRQVTRDTPKTPRRARVFRPA